MTAPDEIDRQVSARMQRQHRLTGPQPLQLSAVVSEAALRRYASHPAIAPGQLQHLIAQANLPNIDLRVLPFSAGLHQSMSGSFSLLSFPGGVLPDAAYQEYAVGGHVIDDQVIVGRLDRLFAALRDQALGADESLVVISELLSTTGPRSPPGSATASSPDPTTSAPGSRAGHRGRCRCSGLADYAPARDGAT
ncbi:MAG: DUF5753 domain-containing protein [Pseudonocardiaceae bacterium]